MSIDEIIAANLQRLRRQQGLSLDALATQAGVSKAMISKIERQESSPSATVLGRLAAGLGVSLTDLLLEQRQPQPLRRLADQLCWQDPELHYLRRQITERDALTGFEMVEIVLPVDCRVEYPRWSHHAYRQRLWLISGELAIEYGELRYLLAAGDCLDFDVDQPLALSQRGEQPCRYLLVMTSK
ncbi:helix-turn-helix domain-containing protein [Pantoea sp. B65]|uniref:helix-turn-helix domain-containing protein n=1 Tax=Pantoea sp. B65 TaxID=2813359 RepID=UPI0039B6DCB9